jgi:UDP-N-acetylglucosamine acyltransferase
VTVDGLSSLVVGLNIVGLRRAGFDQSKIQQLKAAYRLIYRSGLMWKEILEKLRTEFAYGPAALFFEFLSATKRGIVSERRVPPNATLKLKAREQEEEQKVPTVTVRQVAAG